MSSRANDASARDRSYRDGYDRRDRSRDRRGRDKDRDREVDTRRGGRDDRSRSRSPVRRRSRSRSRDREVRRKPRSHSRERRHRSRSRSASISSRSSSDHKRHKRKKDKDRKRKRSRSRDRERKERKKEKKEKKKKKSLAVSHQWGKYGIISETDLYTKEQEFRAWLVEERKINPETITKDQNRKEFARFVEDYNTATLPHEKFYDMTTYERRMNALRSGAFIPPTDDLDGSGYDPAADLRILQSQSTSKRKKEAEAETYMNREQLMELRKIQAERIEAGKMKLLGMDIKQNMGIRMDTAFE